MLQNLTIERFAGIEAAMTSLPIEEGRRLVAWLRAHEQGLWDEQMDGDSAGGKLDYLFRDAEGESRAGLVRDWPPAE
jgi:hypothetical protein